MIVFPLENLQGKTEIITMIKMFLSADIFIVKSHNNQKKGVGTWQRSDNVTQSYNGVKGVCQPQAKLLCQKQSVCRQQIRPISRIELERVRYFVLKKLSITIGIKN